MISVYRLEITVHGGGSSGGGYGGGVVFVPTGHSKSNFSAKQALEATVTRER